MKLTAAQRRVLERMAAGERLVVNAHWYIHLIPTASVKVDRDDFHVLTDNQFVAAEKQGMGRVSFTITPAGRAALGEGE